MRHRWLQTHHSQSCKLVEPVMHIVNVDHIVFGLTILSFHRINLAAKLVQSFFEHSRFLREVMPEGKKDTSLGQ